MLVWKLAHGLPAHARIDSSYVSATGGEARVTFALELVAGVAAVVFITAMLWSDFAAPDRDGRRVRPLQYASAVIVLACVVVLGIRG